METNAELLLRKRVFVDCQITDVKAAYPMCDFYINGIAIHPLDLNSSEYDFFNSKAIEEAISFYKIDKTIESSSRALPFIEHKKKKRLFVQQNFWEPVFKTANVGVMDENIWFD